MKAGDVNLHDQETLHAIVLASENSEGEVIGLEWKHECDKLRRAAQELSSLERQRQAYLGGREDEGD